MAVVEYKMHKINNKGHKKAPDFIEDGGNWLNPSDHTMIGWIEDNPEYYIPNTVNTLTKQQFVDRQLAIHAVEPFSVENEDETRTVLTTEEVTTEAEEWYLSFVTKNTPAP